MRILLDNCVDQKFAALMPMHEVIHARKMGWALLENGDLIKKAEDNGFQVMITVDKNLRYQQNIADRKISIVTLDSRRMTYRHIAPLVDKVIAALQNLTVGSFITIKSES